MVKVSEVKTFWGKVGTVKTTVSFKKIEKIRLLTDLKVTHYSYLKLHGLFCWNFPQIGTQADIALKLSV